MSTPHPTPEPRARVDLLAYGLVLLAIALAFQGSRGIFEPDEGRYVDAALAMLRTGDWLVPRLQGLVYLDKPPAIYWSIAAGFKLLGVNEWGARLCQALALAATAYVVAGWSGIAWGKRVGRLAGAAYVTTLLPLLAANALTPDTLLTLWTTAAAFSYWRWRDAEGPGQRWRWALLLGVSFGFALLTKGAAALVFLAPVVLHALWESGPRRLLSRPELGVAALVGTALGLSWYAFIAHDIPGAAQYFFDNQISGRLWQDTYRRSPEWWAPIKVYGPPLILGSLPWSLTWLDLWRSRERRQRLAHLWSDPLNRYLLLSALVPLVVFSLAKSKLPLYVLPAAPYLLMLTISQATRKAGPAWARRVLATAAIMVLLKGLAAIVPARHDSRALAAKLLRAGVSTEECIDTLEAKVYGLGLYGYRRVTSHLLWPTTYPYFEDPPTLEDGLPAILERCDGRVRLLAFTKNRPVAAAIFDRAQLTCSDETVSSELTLFSCAEEGGSERGSGAP